MSELEQVKKLCRTWGADDVQATVMARQLMKRADQMAAQRNCSREEAMHYLLDLTRRGARGETSPGFEGGAPPA